MKILKYTFFGLALSTLVFACDDEDFTGDSSLTPSSPTISVDLSAYPGSISFVEKDSTFTFPVTLSEPQIVDISVYIVQAEGTATMGVDYTVDNSNGRVFIPAGKTSGVASVTVLADSDPEDDETFVLQIGDERTSGASLTPVTVSFTIANSFSEDLDMHLSWSVNDVFYPDGSTVPATTMADLILYVLDADGAVYGGADGASFEDYALTSADPDGTYTIAVGIYAFDSPGDGVIDVLLETSQAGVQSGSFAFSSLTTANCLTDLVYLATVTKAGAEYTITEAISTAFEVDILAEDETLFAGDYQLTYVSGDEPFGDPAFSDQVLTITRVDADTRSFSAIYLEDGGYGNDPVTFVFHLGCGEVTVPQTGSTDLACAAGVFITLGPAADKGEYDLSDDSSLTIIFSDMYTDGGCGVSPSPVEIELTRI